MFNSQKSNKQSVIAFWFDLGSYASFSFKITCSVKVTMFKKETNKNSGKTYKIEKSEKIDMEINLLQATLIHRDIQQVKAITSLANEKGKDILNHLLTSKITCNSTEFEDWTFKPNCRWILEGTTIHLAANWHIESLVHFLGLRPNDPKFCQKLINLTSKYSYTPLHVAAVQENTLVTRYLIHKKAKTGAQNDKERTALHLAVKTGSINNVITLIYDGLACLIDQDYKGETPLHLAKTSKILNVLLSKIKAQELVSIEKSYEKSLAIIKKQGTSGLPEVHDNIDGTQSCKATHAAEKVSS